jgi:hypothetical protein
MSKMLEMDDLPHEAESMALDRAPRLIDERIGAFCARVGAESHGDTRVITDGFRLVRVRFAHDEVGSRLVWRTDPTAVILG